MSKIYTSADDWVKSGEIQLSTTSDFDTIVKSLVRQTWEACEINMHHKYKGRLANIGTAIARIKEIVETGFDNGELLHKDSYKQITELIAIIERDEK